MTQIFHINGEPLENDTSKTKEFYLTQHKITDDCECDDCNFYATNFINNKFEIFSLLETMGIDLSKNLGGEPTGVWCIRDDKGEFLHCLQVYQAVGQFVNENATKLSYEKTENNYKICAAVVKTGNGRVDFELIIDKV